MAPFTQKDWISRCEWGCEAVNALAPADVIIVVDVFSFGTCVDVAVSRGVTIIPYGWNGWNDPSAAEFARSHGAELAGKRRLSRYSLAPKSVPRCAGGPSVRVAVAERGPGVARRGGERRRGACQLPEKRARRCRGRRARGRDVQRDSVRRALAGRIAAARAGRFARSGRHPVLPARAAFTGGRGRRGDLRALSGQPAHDARCVRLRSRAR